MSERTRNNLIRVADQLEKSLRFIAGAIELVMIDLAWGKGKYRKRGPKMRPIIHRTYNRTVVVREPLSSERLHIVRTNREQ
jgi:hypothetical protein